MALIEAVSEPVLLGEAVWLSVLLPVGLPVSVGEMVPVRVAISLPVGDVVLVTVARDSVAEALEVILGVWLAVMEELAVGL